ncbi:hypothetical protein ABZS96_35815, partial [Streptomyces avermitilis]
MTRLHADHSEIVLVWADNAYGGEEFTTRAQDTLGITIKVVPRHEEVKGFVVLPKRWMVVHIGRRTDRGTAGDHSRERDPHRA